MIPDKFQLISGWLTKLQAALAASDIDSVVSMFSAESYWRDLIALTWNIHTAEGPESIAAMLRATLSQAKPSGFRAEGETAGANGVTEGWFSFETKAGRGRGHVRLRDGKAVTLLTSMTELKGHEEKAGETREMGAEHGVARGRKHWAERRAEEAAELGHTRQSYTLIIGGGQAGLALGARLKRLGVPAIIVEKNKRAGDSWRNRYNSLCLHDPVWYDHMPYLPFPGHWPVFSPKDKMGDWLEMYAKVMELNVWSSTICKSARYDETAGEWIVVVERDRETITLRPKQLVLATGMSGLANLPSYPGMDDFKGQQHHSSRHPGGAAYAGKQCVVIGSNNSAHDICADLWEHGAEVTMVQRSSTHVVKSGTLMELSLGPLYSERAVQSGITTDVADMIVASIPYAMQAGLQKPLYRRIAEQDADFYDRLRQAGFMLDFGDDESGLTMKYLRRGSGYYIDVGASELIADGSIRLKSGVAVERLTEHSVVLSDGTELPADLVVYATGYGSMNGWAELLISKEVADKVGKCWGLGSGTAKDPGPWQGELRNMWKPTRQEALWFHGGNLHQSRHYSHYLSLQLKARMEGIPTPVYALAEVHHTH